MTPASGFRLFFLRHLHPFIATTVLLVRGTLIRWLSLLQVVQVTEACPALVLIAPWGIIDKTQGALHVGL